MNTTPEQIRAARALLRMEQADLASRANVSLVTVRRAEGAAGSERVAPATIAAIQLVLEQSGAEFIPDGVRRRAPAPRDPALFDDRRAISMASAAEMAGRDPVTASTRARALELSRQSGMSATDIIEDALRGYVPPGDEQPVGRLARRGPLLVLPAAGAAVSLETANQAIDQVRERDLF